MLSLPRRIAPGEVPATSETWGFLGVLVCAQGDSLAENRAMWIDRFVFWNQFLNKNSIYIYKHNICLYTLYYIYTHTVYHTNFYFTNFFKWLRFKVGETFFFFFPPFFFFFFFLLPFFLRLLFQCVCVCARYICVFSFYIYISRIRRNLSIHIAWFSASESPRAIYQHSQNSPIFAGS